MFGVQMVGLDASVVVVRNYCGAASLDVAILFGYVGALSEVYLFVDVFDGGGEIPFAVFWCVKFGEACDILGEGGELVAFDPGSAARIYESAYEAFGGAWAF